ncbi:hypothetical protein N0V90_003699 [Kalmusia sp. IMI 367209]|nr:hypothetical protein N0V90_003699 [Kalmusia sp. IMI 367209]
MSTQTGYVYIPNLIGGQMLRIPVLALEDDYEEDSQTVIPETSDLTLDASSLPIPSTRDASPASTKPGLATIWKEVRQGDAEGKKEGEG